MRVEEDDERGDEDAQALDEVADDVDESCPDVDVLALLHLCLPCIGGALGVSRIRTGDFVAVAMTCPFLVTVAVAGPGIMGVAMVGSGIMGVAMASSTSSMGVSVLVQAAAHAVSMTLLGSARSY